MKRHHAILLGSGIIIVGMFAAFILSAQKTPTKRQGSLSESKPISTMTVNTETIPLQFTAGGRVTSAKRIAVFAEVSGVLLATATPFKEGSFFRRGDTLIHIDDAVYRNNLLAQKSTLLNQLTQAMPDLHMEFSSEIGKWQRYLAVFTLDGTLADLPKSSGEKETYFLAARNVYNLFYSARSMEATLAKYTLTAPFNGIVSESALNPGTLVRNGQQLGVFVNTDLYEVEVPVRIEDLQHIGVGMRAELRSSDVHGTFKGTVRRINPVVDQSSQTGTVFIAVSDARLSDGMYLTATLKGKESKLAARIPRTAVDNSGYVYLQSDSSLKQHAVVSVNVQGEDLIVTGLANGDVILCDSDDAAEYQSSNAPRSVGG